ncbi:probable polygalacturonase At3g15720 [Rosa chinensis]|uniref:probable polygalacturonase At3g15720 n=1 Tax=Rosa chinensis TaxID=74649 RepID=UPI000D08CBE7|nr:probable polygalacturonase At3g15720 [Rosa chinensis]
MEAQHQVKEARGEATSFTQPRSMEAKHQVKEARGVATSFTQPRSMEAQHQGLLSLLTSVLISWIVASPRFGNGLCYGQNRTLNVLDFGASGDGIADDTEAFLNAWKTLCETGQTLNIPAGKTFVVKPLQLVGPCKSNNVGIQIDGNIVGPSTLSEWADACKIGQCWLCFLNVKGLVIKGEGLINGNGPIWWKQETQSINDTDMTCKPPTALNFHKCDQLQLSGFTSRDSPRAHIFIHSSNGVRISNIHLSAPEKSPNTDGIDISLSSQVTIQDSFIGTGDDCIAIKGGSSFVNITHVTCGPGHGFSVGSLGQDPATTDNVEQVHFQNCICNKSTNCARIKTWMGGSGYARAIFFRQMILEQSQNPIIIDQHYCNGGHNCPAKTGAVKVSNVTFSGITGTSASEQAITLDCSDLGCTDILMDHVNITSASGLPLRSVCNKASGKASFTSPPIPCLSSNGSLSSVIAPISVNLLRPNHSYLSYFGIHAHKTIKA